MITGPNVGHDAYKTKGQKSYLCSWRYHFRVMINRLNGAPNDKRGDSKWDIIIARVNGVCFIPTAELVSLGFDLPIAEGLPQVAPLKGQPVAALLRGVSPGPRAPAFTVDTKPQRLRRDVVALLLLLARGLSSLLLGMAMNRQIIGDKQ